MAQVRSLVLCLRAAAASAVLILAVGCGQKEAAGEWPQFRGPAGLAVSDAGPLPTTWSPGSDNIRWRTAIPGSGNSSPIVSGDRVYLTTAIRGKARGTEKPPIQRAVLALDLATGKVLWQTPVFTSPRSKRHQFNTYAAPTPVTDGEALYTYFGSHLTRLTLDGKIVWDKEVEPTAHYDRFSHYGTASSPILSDDMIFVAQDQEEPLDDDIGWLAAFDKETGDEIWRQQWNNTCCSYSTPHLWKREGADEELIFAYSGALAAHDPRTGEKLWEHLYPMWQFVNGLVIEGDIVCALGGAHNQRGNVCMRVTGPSRSAKIERLWHEPRRAPETASPVLYRDKVYAVTSNGVMSCYDLKSGKLHWAEDLKGGRGFRASLVAGDGKVYALPTWGPTAVIDATTNEFKPLAFNDVGEGGNNATPAIGGGCLLLRAEKHLYCVEKEKGAPAQQARAGS